MSTRDLKGLYSALLVAFDENGNINEKGLRQIVRHNIDVCKMDGLYVGGVMSLLCLPCGKFSLAFLAVPAGKDGRVECPCQTVDDFIGVRGSVCGLFLFVQTHAPLIVPPWQSRARKSKFQFLSGARARMLSALHLRLVAR